ncbi:MAG: ImmA/IrrE family metallo-endopeptidase [Eubacterium sp.]|nr:ImmA/IrrE family metallo-endopeptidase [Eubacterium sp.]
MNKYPNYSFATNAAYMVLKNYMGPYPQIDIFKVVSDLSNVSIHTYSETSKRFDMTISQFLNVATSAHGYTVYNATSKKGTIYFNDLKDECTIRFTVAHELGHIILDHTQDNAVARSEANCFARNLLCPVPLRDGFHLKTVQDYCECFNISEYMAKITRDWYSNDNYYISKENYNFINDRSYVYISGYTLSELYG